MALIRSITDAASNGTRLDVLVALRDRIAAEIEVGVPARDLAALSRQLRDVTKEIDALNTAEEASPADDVANRRAARRAVSKAARRPAR